MYSIAEELENIGKQKGIEQGIRQGKEETYYRMFSNNRTLEDISEFTGESMDYLYRLHEKYLDMVREEGKYESGTMSNGKFNCFYSSPIGSLKIEATEQGICAIRFLGEKALSQEECSAASHPLLQQAVRELDEYFRGDRQVFTLPLVPQGTPFQHSVWEALQKIPYGATCSYGEIAAAIGNPKASRAVGMANNKNPLPILIPCHRVIGADGRLVGYGGGLDIKRKLLALEQGQR